MLKLAIKLASKSLHKQHFHAAIITCGGAVVSTGYNHKFLHAEMDALGKLKPSQSRKRLTLYSFRWRKGGQFGMAKPCSKCLPWLSGFKVYFTNETGELVRL